MKSLFTFLFLFCCYSAVFAQKNFPDRKNLIFIEGGGAFAAGVGIGYERYLPVGELSRFSARTGAGLIDHFSLPAFFAGSSFMFGRKYQGELGLNYINRIDLSNFKPLDDNDERIRDGIQFLVGLRYQNWSNGLFFRIFYVPPIGAFQSFLPYGGASLGFAF